MHQVYSGVIPLGIFFEIHACPVRIQQTMKRLVQDNDSRLSLLDHKSCLTKVSIKPERMTIIIEGEQDKRSLHLVYTPREEI
jgi:hypothetical protein